VEFACRTRLEPGDSPVSAARDVNAPVLAGK